MVLNLRNHILASDRHNVCDVVDVEEVSLVVEDDGINPLSGVIGSDV